MRILIVSSATIRKVTADNGGLSSIFMKRGLSFEQLSDQYRKLF